MITSHIPFLPKTVAIDFDGTLNEYKEWGDGKIKNNPLEGAVEAINTISSLGYKVVIYTCRMNVEVNNVIEQLPMLQNWLKENNLEFVEISMTGKPIADIYIDDRAIEFKGNWNEVTERIKNARK
jgi:hydroxymethylpyrimidine pyrophosphatase-like HAD family hydrolase